MNAFKKHKQINKRTLQRLSQITKTMKNKTGQESKTTCEVPELRKLQ